MRRLFAPAPDDKLTPRIALQLVRRWLIGCVFALIIVAAAVAAIGIALNFDGFPR